MKTKLWVDVNLIKVVDKETPDKVLFDCRRIEIPDEIDYKIPEGTYLKKTKREDGKYDVNLLSKETNYSTTIKGNVCGKDYSMTYFSYKFRSTQYIIETRDKYYYYSVTRVKEENVKYSMYAVVLYKWILLEVLLDDDNLPVSTRALMLKELRNMIAFEEKFYSKLMNDHINDSLDIFNSLINTFKLVDISVKYNDNEYIVKGKQLKPYKG